MNAQDMQLYIRDNRLDLLRVVRESYEAFGRGCYVIDGSRPGQLPWTMQYVTLEAAERVGFTEKFINSVRDYNPESEIIIWFMMEDHASLLRLSVEWVGSGPFPSVN